MNAPPLISFDDVAAGYGVDPVFTGLSFSLNTGEGLCFLGANGSGKSTILRAAVRTCAVMRGSVRYLGEDVVRIPRHDLAARGLAYVTQSRGLFANLTVEENIRVAALAAGESGSSKAVALLERFSLTRQFMKQKTGRLSGGERTIVALARALVAVSRVKILLLDEVSAGLSPRNTETLEQLLKDLRLSGIGLLMSEQNELFVDALAISIRRVTRTFAPMIPRAA